jgi:hypothetical protein
LAGERPCFAAFAAHIRARNGSQLTGGETMRKLKVLWRATRAQRVLEELETWSTLLLGIGAALLLLATLQAQAAHGAVFPRDVGAPTCCAQHDDVNGGTA